MSLSISSNYFYSQKDTQDTKSSGRINKSQLYILGNKIVGEPIEKNPYRDKYVIYEFKGPRKNQKYKKYKKSKIITEIIHGKRITDANIDFQTKDLNAAKTIQVNPKNELDETLLFHESSIIAQLLSSPRIKNEISFGVSFKNQEGRNQDQISELEKRSMSSKVDGWTFESANVKKRLRQKIKIQNQIVQSQEQSSNYQEGTITPYLNQSSQQYLMENKSLISGNRKTPFQDYMNIVSINQGDQQISIKPINAQNNQNLQKISTSINFQRKYSIQDQKQNQNQKYITEMPQKVEDLKILKLSTINNPQLKKANRYQFQKGKIINENTYYSQQYKKNQDLNVVSLENIKRYLESKNNYNIDQQADQPTETEINDYSFRESTKNERSNTKQNQQVSNQVSKNNLSSPSTSSYEPIRMTSIKNKSISGQTPNFPIILPDQSKKISVFKKNMKSIQESEMLSKIEQNKIIRQQESSINQSDKSIESQVFDYSNFKITQNSKQIKDENKISQLLNYSKIGFNKINIDNQQKQFLQNENILNHQNKSVIKENQGSLNLINLDLKNEKKHQIKLNSMIESHKLYNNSSLFQYSTQLSKIESERTNLSQDGKASSLQSAYSKFQMYPALKFEKIQNNKKNDFKEQQSLRNLLDRLKIVDKQIELDKKIREKQKIQQQIEQHQIEIQNQIELQQKLKQKQNPKLINDTINMLDNMCSDKKRNQIDHNMKLQKNMKNFIRQSKLQLKNFMKGMNEYQNEQKQKKEAQETFDQVMNSKQFLKKFNQDLNDQKYERDEKDFQETIQKAKNYIAQQINSQNFQQNDKNF